jgi:uncharacterized membrane protein YhiD involved in acid resistance
MPFNGRSDNPTAPHRPRNCLPTSNSDRLGPREGGPQRRPAHLSLVAIATCGFVEGTENFLRGSPEAQARVIEGLITGVGFIGGGAILRQGASVHGTATAASLWATGAVGVASALGAYEVAGLIAIVTFLTLRFLAPLKRETPSDRKPE